MGWPMAANLARAGFDLSVWTREPAKAGRFAEEHGARAAPTPAEAAQAAGTAISMVPDTPEVEAVLLGEEGAAAGMADGDLCIDMSTIAPTATKAIGERLAERGSTSSTPCHGFTAEGRGRHAHDHGGRGGRGFERARPLFEAMGELVVQVDPTATAKWPS